MGTTVVNQQDGKGCYSSRKSLIVSSFDRSLPNVSLEFFLKNEGEGAPIKWEVNDCGEMRGRERIPATDDGRYPPMCVEADFEAKSRIAVTVLVSVGTFKGGPSGVPALLSVTITDLSGISRPVRHLGDLPMELHRPAPRLPRDVPDPVGGGLKADAISLRHLLPDCRSSGGSVASDGILIRDVFYLRNGGANQSVQKPVCACARL